MNVKQASVFAGTVAALAMAGTASAAFQGIASSVANVGADGTTYRIYAQMDQGDRLDAVAGNGSQGLALTSVTGFYHNSNGGPTSKDINSNFFSFVPSLEWDSYVTVGALYADGSPFGENALNNVGIDWSAFEAGGDLETDNGTWFVTPDKAQGEAIDHGGDIGYGVLIAQVTTSDNGGTFSGLLQGKDANGDTWSQGVNGAAYGGGDIPAPGALALLGLAGVAGRRRRRA
jgi:MYXO-CTERM domain-containing protein